MKISKLGLRFYISGMLFLIAGALLLLDLRVFAQQSDQSFQSSAGPEDADSSLVIRELQSQLNVGDPRPTRYSIIAEQNLFSPDREAWAPPPPEEPAAEEPPPPAPANRNDVVLQGTYISGGVKKAILTFRFFRNEPKTRILTEGEEARDEGDNARGSYTLQKITDDRVELMDNQKRSFSVGLYDHKKATPASTQQQTTIEVQKDEQAPVVSATPEGGTSGPAPAKASASPGAESKGPPLSATTISKMSQEEKDRMVEEGRLRKINTPFGNVYKPMN